MKNIKFFALAAVAAFGLASCSNEIDEKAPQGGMTSGEAYLSIRIKKTEQTRGSSEENGSTAENLLSSLYLITLDAGNAVLSIPGGSAAYIPIVDPDGVDPTPEPVKISATAKKLVVIANPGAKLLARLNNMGAGTPWATVNAAIEAAAISEIKSDTKGFTMITAGEIPTTITPLPLATTIPTTAHKHTDPFVDLNGKVYEIVASEAEAKEDAEGDPVTVRLERLASKLNVTVAAEPTKPASSSFTFLKWTVDAVNTTFIPYANKVILFGAHTVPGPDPAVYTYNFYTEDPNFDEVMSNDPIPVPTYHPSLSYGKADPDATPKFEPKLAQDQIWRDAGTDVGYVIENTMAASAQRFGSATRLVIQATYYPAGFSATDGDWFQWANENFTFETLQAAYAEAAELDDPTESPLYNACEAFLVKVKAVKGSLSSVANFGALTKADIADIANGGDVVKDGSNAVIRWYKGGLNYYYYEIRHDNERDGRMLFGKYGVVRNNSYKLTLNKVNGPGTPWYPDLVNPGDGDPDPEDQIDDATGFLGISVETNPWILWETGFEI